MSSAQTEVMRAGVVGAGVFGRFHAQKYAGLHDLGVVLSAIYDPDAGRAELLGQEFGAASFANLGAFLEQVDVVTIAAPALHHGRLAQEVLEAGKHCYIEKPIAVTLDEANAIVACAERQKRVVQVGHQERFVASHHGLLPLDIEDISEIAFTRIGKASGRGEDVSVIMDLMIHDLDLARQFLQQEPVAISADGDEHETQATLLFPNGKKVHFHASRRATSQERCVRLTHRGGETVFNFADHRFSGAALPAKPANGHVTPQEVTLADPLGRGVAEFVNAVREQTVSPIPASDGRDALAWALRIEAARQDNAKQVAEAYA